MILLIKRLIILPVITLALLIAMPITAFASEVSYEITVSPPSMSGAPATIRVNDGTGLVAAQAKLDDTGDWLDLPMLIEFDWAHFDLPYSGRIYISLTDEKGNVHVASEQVNLPPSSVPTSPPVEEPQNTEAPDSPAAVTPPSTSTSTGILGATGNVADNITASGEIREFFTVTTDNGGIFFLVVDRPSGGVHLLSAVDERDLADFIDDKQGSDLGSSPPSSVHPAEPSEPAEATPEPEPQPKKRSGVSLIPILLLMLAAGGGAYYWKIVRPKQNADTDDYEDEDNPSETEDSEPDMEFETERDKGGEESTEDYYFDESEDLEPV